MFKTEPLIVTYELFKENPELFIDSTCDYIQIERTKDVDDIMGASSRVVGKGVEHHVRDGNNRQFEKELD